jgi:hypothetical protein
MDERKDLPGYSETQTTERLGVLAVQDYLVRNRFKVTEVTGAFDDGLELMVSPHNGLNVLPLVAAIQVRDREVPLGLHVGRHERSWRALNLPRLRGSSVRPATSTPGRRMGGRPDVAESEPGLALHTDCGPPPPQQRPWLRRRQTVVSRPCSAVASEN